MLTSNCNVVSTDPTAGVDCAEPMVTGRKHCLQKNAMALCFVCVKGCARCVWTKIAISALSYRVIEVWFGVAQCALLFSCLQNTS